MTQTAAPERFTVRSSSLIIPILIAYCALKLVFLTFFSVNTTYVMDEFAQAGYSKHIEDGLYTTVDPVKTVIWVYVYHLARILAADSNELMQLARLEALIMSLAIVALCGASARRLGRSATAVLFTVAALLSFSNYLERSFRVRSDTVAVLWLTGAMWVLVGKWPSLWRPFVVGLLAGGAFLSTQKAVYGVVALGFAILAVEGTLPQRFRRGLVYALAVLATIGAYGLFFRTAGFMRVMEMVFFSPAAVAMKADDFYADLAMYTRDTLRRNWFAYALAGGGVLAAVARFRRAGDSVRAAAVFTVVITIFVFLHNQPWPYVFVMALPALSLWTPELPALFARRFGWQEATLLLVALAILAFSFGRNIAYLEHENAVQRLVVAQAEALLAPGDRYQDGVGMITTRSEAVESWWDLMNSTLLRRAAKEGDLREVERIFANQPKLWIINYRVLNLMNILGPHLQNSYLPVASNILLSGTVIREGEESLFINRWPGAYQAYDPEGAPTRVPFEIDGRVALGAVQISRGPHRIRGLTAGTYALCPAGLRLPLPAEAGPPIEIYPRVYE